MARALGVASGDGRGWAMSVVRSAGLSCHPCLPLSWVNAVSPGIVAALMASWTHLMPAGGGVSSPRTFAWAASSPWTRFALPPGHVLSTLSVRTPPPEGRALRSVQSLAHSG